ncbi:MAG: NAD(P)H-hydrate epimerase [Phycisphaerae bacterium]|nr:NAD(P)H-hydrate epimerase [Phycisphaerae bacterium]
MAQELILSRDQVREVDRRAIDDYGIPGIVLMENASRGLAQVARQKLGHSVNPRVAIVTGTGNNAGDGFAVARHLHNAQCQPVVLIAGAERRIAGDARTNLEIIKRMSLCLKLLSQDQRGLAELADELQRAELVIDAIFGTGLSGQVRGFYKDVIERINSNSTPVLAVDIPSGLDCDTGQPLGLAVRAQTTVTFVARKMGFDAPGADAYTGQVFVVDIGAPTELLS